MGNSLTAATNGIDENNAYHQSTFGYSQKSDKKASSSNPESSRVLFLLYLIHRTWNVVVETVDPKSRRARLSRSTSEDLGTSRSCCEDDFKTHFLDFENSLYSQSQYSRCSCNYCSDSEPKNNPLFGKAGVRLSFCESEYSYCFGCDMAPSAGKSPPSSQMSSLKISTEISIGLNTQSKENQRPPVYNAEDYINSLKKYTYKSNMNKSVYSESSTVNEKLPDSRCSTMPSKHTEYKSPIPTPPETECEMSLRQFGSITDLLSKLRADLKTSFPSFVQEFVSSPLDGVSLLLEVLRAIQLSQTMNVFGTINSQQNTVQHITQTYQRRALLDELACLQCLNLCSTRSPEASVRLGTTPTGLLPLAASATGQGIRSRILALQLLTSACDKTSLSHGSQKSVQSGHTSVSEALSTLRLRCGEPVRFRLLIGMLSSGGGTGELQAYGLKFINTFLESAENIQNRLYLQAELYQAGFEPTNMTKTISSSSPWVDKIRAEVKHYEEVKLDVDKLLLQARESDRIRSQMVILERRVQILQEEKSVLTTMERRLQERCAELQREIFRLQGANQQDGCKSLEKRPVALPRQVPPHNKPGSSEQDDEGISSSETGQSLSPEPILVFPQKNSQKFRTNLTKNSKEEDVTIDEVIEELENIVNDAEREITVKSYIDSESIPPDGLDHIEKDIVPVNLLPQPPKKFRSLARVLSSGSEFDESDYGLLLIHDGSKNSIFDELNNENYNSKYRSLDEIPNSDINDKSSTNREILDVIMDAREKDANRNAFPVQQENCERAVGDGLSGTPQQKFSGVFFMTEMNAPQKYPKPDIAAALEARRVSKTINRIESYGSGLDSLIDIVMPSIDKKLSPNRQLFSSPNTTRFQYNKSGGFHSLGNQLNRPHNGSRLSDLPSGLY